MINVAAPGGDERLLNALATTLHTEFPSVFIIDLKFRSQAKMLVGVTDPVGLDRSRETTAQAEGLARALAYWARNWARDHYTPSRVLTDDHAPVEWMMDQMILDQVVAADRES